MRGEWVSHGHLRGSIGALDDIRDPVETIDEPIPPMPIEGEWDGRREAYRMFADKLWDKASNEEDEDSMENHHGHHKGKKGGCHGKKHHGQHG